MSLRKEYRLRAFIVLCFVMSVAGIIGIASLFPAFLAASIEKKSAETKLSLIKKSTNQSGLTAIQQKVAFSQGLLNMLDQGSGQMRISSIVEEIVGNKGINRLTLISAKFISTTTVSMSMSGIAPTRDSLLSFKSRLLSIYPGSKVDLPISELAKSSDIPFNIQVTAKMQ